MTMQQRWQAERDRADERMDRLGLQIEARLVSSMNKLDGKIDLLNVQLDEGLKRQTAEMKLALTIQAFI